MPDVTMIATQVWRARAISDGDDEWTGAWRRFEQALAQAERWDADPGTERIESIWIESRLDDEIVYVRRGTP
jgi:hypothetical protein